MWLLGALSERVPSELSSIIGSFQIMHGIGMYHTHMRPDRDEFVTVNWENMKSSKRKEFEKCESNCDTHGAPYDCDSVMHYASNQMSKNKKDTLSKIEQCCWNFFLDSLTIKGGHDV